MPIHIDTAAFRQKISEEAPLLRAGGLSLALFTVSMLFSLLLAASLLRAFTSESLLRAYGLASGQLADAVARELRFGRPLAPSPALTDKLVNAMDTAPGLRRLTVLDPAGRVVTAQDAAQGTPLSAAAAAAPKRPSAAPERSPEQAGEAAAPKARTLLGWRLEGDVWTRGYELAGVGGRPAGRLLASVSDSQISGQSRTFVQAAVAALLFLGLTACFALMGWMGRLADRQDRQDLSRVLRRRMLCIVGGAQVVLTVAALFALQHFLDVSVQRALSVSGGVLAADLENLVHKGVRLEGLTPWEDLLRRRVEAAPELGAAALEEQGRTLAAWGAPTAARPLRIPVWRYWPSANVRRTEAAALLLWPDSAFIRRAVREAALDLGTALAVSLLLLHELASFLGAIGLGSAAQRAAPQGAGPPARTPAATGIADAAAASRREVVIRAMTFFFFLGYDMVLSFIPLAAAALPGSIPFVPPELRNALPISVEAAAAGLGLAVVGLRNARSGWRACCRPAFACAVAGALLCALAQHIALFTLGRLLSGVGFGMALMAGQLGALESARGRAAALAGLYAAVFAGSICGSASGAMLCQLFDAALTFKVSAALLLLPPCLLRLLPPRTPPAQPLPQNAACPAPAAGSAWKTLARLAAAPGFLLPVLCVSLPASMCLTGFLYLAVPTLLQRGGVAQSDIGRLFMLYGFCFVCLGPGIAALADKCRSQRPFVAATGLCAGLALLCASLLPGYPGFALAVVLTGISQCLLASSLLVFVLSLPAARSLDAGLVGGACRICERLGQTLGPVAFGAVLAVQGGVRGLPPLGVGFCAAAFCFFVLSAVGRKE